MPNNEKHDINLPQLPDNARMDAYYYGFDRTGVGPIDAVLSAVAVSGKWCHHTADWTEEAFVPADYSDFHPGLAKGATNIADLIQRTANQSAAQIRAALAQRPSHGVDILGRRCLCGWELAHTDTAALQRHIDEGGRR